MKTTFKNIQAEDKIILMYSNGGSNYASEVKFLGFTDNLEPHSQSIAFKNWDELSQAKNVKTFRELQLLDEPKPYGFNTYAIFEDSFGTFEAYLFNGKWSICSGAHPVRIQKVS